MPCAHHRALSEYTSYFLPRTLPESFSCLSIKTFCRKGQCHQIFECWFCPSNSFFSRIIKIFAKYSQRYSNIKSSRQCKIHCWVNWKEKYTLENFKFIFIMLYDEDVHLWSCFWRIVPFRAVADFFCLAMASPVYLTPPNPNSAV